MVKIVECPRDAWQGIAGMMPAEVKADYLRVLIGAGFKHIDAISFVSKSAVPQMADAEKVLTYLDAPGDVEIIGLVLNEKGAERALQTEAVSTLAFPYSISPQFLKRNGNQTPEESLEALEAIGTLGYKAGLEVVAYVAMAFGNPFGEAWSIDEVIDACDLLVDCGVSQISLADTAGLATPRLVADLFTDVRAVHDRVELGLHLHTRPDTTAELVQAAYEAGCRRFDAAIGGLGGCPFAQDALPSNLPTEMLVAELQRLGAELPNLRPLDSVLSATKEIERKYGTRVQ